MADVSRGYAVGDTVYVWYNTDIDLQYTATSRVISSVDVNSSSNDALIKFTVGNSVTDLAATPRVFTTAALCSTAIINALICILNVASTSSGTHGISILINILS